MNNIFNLLDIEGGVRSFFASLAASLSFNLIFIIAVALEAVIILFFAIRARFSYEIRATKALDKLNKWLFVNKKLGTENIKEFTNLVKKTPKRLAYNWQQYILYREKHPSEYLTVENVIDKPLKASSYKTYVRSLSIVSIILAIISFIVGIAHNNSGDTVLNASMIIVASIAPVCILLMWGVATIILNARKNYNLDELYQNHHLFQRFIDNACVDLPAFIDYTLLFTVEEIEKGIPALREYLENRTRKEKEEFDRAKNEMVVYEKYDFEKAGVDGSNILERAMNESETYLNNKSKTLAKIAQFEASLESLKKNFDNIQKDYQRKMQISKENIDRLRQQQEETTSRIESNFLRKQQATEIAKQEKEEADFEQQKRRYLVEKNDYEEEIKNLNKELDEGKSVVERAMLSEYQSFYKRLCQKAFETVDKDVKEELVEVRDEKEKTEDELAEAQTVVKRLEDENSILRKRLNITAQDSARLKPEKEAKPVNSENLNKRDENPFVESFEFADEEAKNDKETSVEEEKTQEVENAPKYEEVVFEESEPEYNMIDKALNNLSEQTEENALNENEEEETQKNDQIEDKEAPKRKRGRPVGSTKQKIQTISRGRGRPRKEKKDEETAPKKRGRPAGSKNKQNSPSVKKRAGATRGRPRKNTSANEIRTKINQEEKKMKAARNTANNQINETIKNLEPNDVDKERLRLINEIEKLKAEASNVKEDTPAEVIEELNQRMETLLDQIDKLG